MMNGIFLYVNIDAFRLSPTSLILYVLINIKLSDDDNIVDNIIYRLGFNIQEYCYYLPTGDSIIEDGTRMITSYYMGEANFPGHDRFSMSMLVPKNKIFNFIRRK